MKTPSFFELRTIVEFLSEELIGSQMQDVMPTEDGLVISFYRFNKEPRLVYLVFDLNQKTPFVGMFNNNPWLRLQKAKPVALFLTAHSKNQQLNQIEMVEVLGRVLKFQLGKDCFFEYRAIPNQVNFIVRSGAKLISWYQVKELPQGSPQNSSADESEEMRSISFLSNQWQRYRGIRADQKSENIQSPFEKWKKNKEKDLLKKQKAISSIEEQVFKFKNEEWALVGEWLKTNGLNKLKPEWSIYIDFEKSVSQNIQKCFEKAKSHKIKVIGARDRLAILKEEIKSLSDLSLEKYESYLLAQNLKKSKTTERKIEGRFRKLMIGDPGLTAYMGKSAADNMILLRKAKPQDLWLHLKDYPSAHAIIHRKKQQHISDLDIKKIATWLVREGLSEAKRGLGGKLSVVLVECRYVKPLKGDKLGRVTYHNAREILIAV